MTALGAKLAADEALECALQSEAFKQTAEIAARKGLPVASSICEAIASFYAIKAQRSAEQVAM